MNYAVHTLNQYYNICKSDAALKEYANEYKTAANFLNGEKIYFNPWNVLRILRETKKSIEAGLNSWGPNYQDQKKRQEKRLKQVNHAIDAILENRFKTVTVKFADPEYNYKTSINCTSTDESLKKYFVNTYFDVGIYPEEKMIKCIAIEVS